jgi:hypothetical protein
MNQKSIEVVTGNQNLSSGIASKRRVFYKKYVKKFNSMQSGLLQENHKEFFPESKRTRLSISYVSLKHLLNEFEVDIKVRFLRNYSLFI